MATTINFNDTTDRERLRFFHHLWRDTVGYVRAAEIGADKQFTQRFFRWPDESADLVQWVNKRAPSRNLYVCPHLFTQKSGKRSHAAPQVWCAWADLDTCPPDKVDPTPSIVVESSPERWQAYWLFDDAVNPEQAQDISRRIAYAHAEFGADTSGWDLSQLLRVPETYNLKYEDPPVVKVVSGRTKKAPTYSPEDFDGLPEPPMTPAGVESEVPAEADLPDPQATLDRYGESLPAYVAMYFAEGSASDRSSALWALEMSCFEAGMTREEVFAVARASKVNKYAADGRPEVHLWREVCSAQATFSTNSRTPDAVEEEIEPEVTLGPLLSDRERKRLSALPETWVDRYVAWAKQRTDAPTDYHAAGALFCLTTVLASSVYIPTSADDFGLNLWTMILADSTLSRKAQPLTANVLTPHGWTMISDLEVGHLVTGADGLPTRVTGLSPIEEQDVYRVTFADGSATECTADHLWTHKRPGHNSPWKVWPLERIMRRPLKASKAWIRQIPDVAPVEFFDDGEPRPIDPYALGLILGDAGISQGSIRFTSVDDELVQALSCAAQEQEMDVRRVGRTISYTVTGNENPWLNALREYGLLGKRSDHKFVPDPYLHGTIADRLALLQGLMDTDGWIGKLGSASFCSSSEQLANDVVHLVRSLGGRAALTAVNPRRYEVRLSLPDPMNPFRLKRKSKHYHTRPRTRSMRSVEHVGRKRVRCLKVEAEDGLYVTDDFIVTHNTTAMKYAISILREVDPEAIAATESSVEGLLSEMANRSGRPSVFYRDEMSGLLASFAKRDYLSGMSETLAYLYDGQFVKRVLRKETVEINDPVFIFFGGGVAGRVFDIATQDYVLDGFFPRFTFIMGHTNPNKVRPIGPPNATLDDKRDRLVHDLSRIRERYDLTMTVSMAGKEVDVAERYIAAPTEAAWRRWQDFSDQLSNEGHSSSAPDLYGPMFERLSITTLKVAAAYASERQEPDEQRRVMIDADDILRAISWAETLRANADHVVRNLGRSHNERLISKIEAYLKGRAAVYRSELMRYFRLTAREANDTFDTMEQRGIITRRRSGRKELIRKREK